ncbi:metal-dependent hydrolase [Solitalea lacus]|uniref:metal-dependent hydrolase n=1 Tax=Solitalea lacus TaxID=2911172 RepID=UPI001EDA40EE|nr:metal-dependent hydrolase [Solitalea lacus]UKJ08162.1 metal-dependent hydrolase [Solitalea lacus]
MKFTYFGHSCFLIETEGKSLLFDPFITGNELAKNIDINSIKADYILISHAHSDHTADVEFIARNTGAKIISSFEIVSHYQKLGFEGHPMNFGGKWNFDFGQVKMVQAMHSSSFADGSYGGAAGGFIITIEGKSIYYSGDTALFSDMELFGKMHNISWAILPIGDNFTMDTEQALMAANMLSCDQIIGVHYDTFGYIVIDHDKAKELFTSNGKELHLLNVGQWINLSTNGSAVSELSKENYMEQ